METLKKLLEENQWSRRSPSLRTLDNKPVPTCPICGLPKEHGHSECWLGQAIELLKEQSTSTSTDTQKVHDDILKQSLEAGVEAVNHITEIAQLKSQVAGLQVNRDSLFEENTRFRLDLKELKSMHEGKMDAADEVITQLETTVTAKACAKDLRIEIIQLSGKIYYWALMHNEKQLAQSYTIDAKDIIEPEADAVAAQLNLPVVVNERK